MSQTYSPVVGQSMVVATFVQETVDGVSDTAPGIVLSVAPDQARAQVLGAGGWFTTTIVCFGSETEARAYAGTHEGHLPPLANGAPARDRSEIFRWVRAAWPVLVPAPTSSPSVPAPAATPAPAPATVTTPAPGTDPAPEQ
jgi:hypothetical protein